MAIGELVAPIDGRLLNSVIHAGLPRGQGEVDLGRMQLAAKRINKVECRHGSAFWDRLGGLQFGMSTSNGN